MATSTNPARKLDGLVVAAFESRMAGPMADLITKHGGQALEAPALREVPIGENPSALEFARRLVSGDFDAVVLLTGVGTRYLAEEVAQEVSREQLIDALGRVKVVVRGPKPMAVMREWKVKVAVTAPEPNTWHEILAALDQALPVKGLRVAVQEYGKSNPELVQGLEERGAQVTRVPVYRWALPEDLGPLRTAIHAICEGQVGAALFTSAQQVVHLLEVAEGEGRRDSLVEALRDRVIVGSIGPTTTQTLEEAGLSADIEPEHPKMGHLVVALADRWRSVKKPALEAGISIEVVADSSQTPQDPVQGSLFLKACRREPTDVTPIWLMRQAGRYMAEYRDLRSRVSFLELCKRPELATEVTVFAAEKLGVDAAILFADILLILEPLGFDLEFAKGEGPVIHNPVRQTADVDRVRAVEDLGSLDYVFEAVRQIRRALRPDLPLIGFAGAPFTLACYAIEGGASRHYERAKSLMYTDPGAWKALMDRLTDATILYLRAQAEAGAQALQVFDSWVGSLSPYDYRRFVQPFMARLFQSLPPSVPTIHFGTDTGSLLELQKAAGGHVIGLDWRVELDQAWAWLGGTVAVQGNLDPTVLLGPIEEVRHQADRILRQANGRPG
ncbi:MAG TPA: uroporphyrinogen decarboxylase, partial [Isosphaeraceae bacterium]|nr:uroporphyrinogen decarboxylase [Isosphaeraceae bacterium]